MILYDGFLNTLKTQLEDDIKVLYYFSLQQDNPISLNSLIGKKLTIEFLNEIICLACQKKIKKTYNGGYCYPCFISLPQNDICIVRPEKCHYHLGTCRDLEWGKKNCMIDHCIYLANSSGLKVGITRFHRRIQRWIDQGAIQAIALAKVPNRLDSGLVEVFLKEQLNDKTNWRKMLKGDVEHVDLGLIALKYKKYILDKFSNLEVLNLAENKFVYPVSKYPSKIVSYNLDKTKIISDVLTGIKGQYLIFSEGVLNIRKFQSYRVVCSY